MKSNSHSSRRSFIKKTVMGTAIVSASPTILANSYSQQFLLNPRDYEPAQFSANDQVQLALIGTGIQGINDTISALQVPGVKLVAACDLYTGRLARAKELWGDDIFVTRDYREILNRDDVDAVIIATPDHWHIK
ncbi:MAG TPA: gfo/Idh/MocA family oxidoreductase, partial [Draconibacterium sp.]|nr:gfo/Idh/MocA family oxidoreductase [Draconibacterium sp.]